MGKKTTTLWLDEGLVKKCKALGINLSKTCEMTLRVVSTGAKFTVEEVQLEVLKNERRKLVRQREDLQSSVHDIQLRIDWYSQRIKKQEALIEEIKRSDEIAHLMRVLNQSIQDAEFDIDKLRGTAVSTLQQLEKMGVKVNETGWLEKQIERVKRLM